MKTLKRHWEIKTLGEIATISSGGTPSRKQDDYWKGDIPWVTTAEVKFNTIIDTAEKITEKGLNNSSAKLFPIDTILMAMYGQGKTRGQVAKLGIEATTNQACAAIMLKEGYFVDFYYQYLMSKYDDIREMSNSGGQENLSASIVKSIKVPVPPFEEQTKIAEILSTWDKAIQTTEKLIENSQQKKKALMQKLLNNKNSLDWEEKTLDELYSFKKGKGLSKDKISSNGKFKCILYGELYTRYNEVVNEVISYTDVEDGTLSKSGDILIPSSTTTNGIDLANATAILEDNILLGGDINILRPKCNVSAILIAYILTHIKKYEIAKKTQGITIIHLYGSDLKDIKVFIPKLLAEQEKIAEVLSTTDQEIETLQRKLGYLKVEKCALMQKLLA